MIRSGRLPAGRLVSVAAGQPSPDVAVPAAVILLAAGRPIRPVWQNERGGLTFTVGDAGPAHEGAVSCFVTWAPVGCGINLDDEAARLTWAAPFTAVPRLLDHGQDESGSWLVTAPVPGQSAVAPRWLAEPRRAITAMGVGLRALHDALPVETCPFSWLADTRLADIRRRASRGLVDPANWHPEHAGLGLDTTLQRVSDVPPMDRLVVCHGDACAPNTLVGDDGTWSGHVDLGALGRADRWADLAVATWSTEWNFGPGWDGLLLDAYGVAADPERVSYYRLLWDLGD